jgi:hypothetical protein
LGVALGNFTFDMLLDQQFVEDALLNTPRPGAGVGFDQPFIVVSKFQATFKY